MTTKTTNKYAPEVRERAGEIVLDHDCSPARCVNVRRYKARPAVRGRRFDSLSGREPTTFAVSRTLAPTANR